jgi:hypothetical protein
MMALGRKIITYRDVDIPFAVACLSTVPFESMVKELKSAVPSIQSDFSRLRTVAMIGEQLSQMWQQEESLLLFQSLQTNAKWWHILASYGIKIDSRAFQSPNAQQRDDCIRSVVPLLLQRTGDISLAMEYCNQFDLEAHYASTCYIEHILVSKPLQIASTLWASNIKKVCSTVEERLIIDSLQQILPKIHPLDYEKVSLPPYHALPSHRSRSPSRASGSWTFSLRKIWTPVVTSHTEQRMKTGKMMMTMTKGSRIEGRLGDSTRVPPPLLRIVT